MTKVARIKPAGPGLKGFDRIMLRPEAKVGWVSFTLPGAALKFPGLDFAPLCEPGEIEILAGPSADRSRILSVTVKLV